MGTCYPPQTSASARPADPKARRAPTEIEFRIAAGREELFGAFALVYEAYVGKGLARPNPFRMRVTPCQLRPTTEVFVAARRNDVLATMSLVRDSGAGLPMECLYPDEIASQRNRGSAMAEVSCLATRPGQRESSLSLIIRLMGFMAQTARYRGVDQLIIVVHPRHADFYHRFVAFEPLGPIKTCPSVRNHPGIAMSLDLVHMAQNAPRAYRRFFGSRFPEETMHRRPLSEAMLAEMRCLAAQGESSPHSHIMLESLDESLDDWNFAQASGQERLAG